MPPEPSPARPPIWMPAGGRGALFFWGGLALLLAVGLISLYRNFTVAERQGRLLRDDQHRLVSQNEELRSEVDKLQTELSQAGSMLKNREQILRETTESLQAVKAQSDQEGAAAEGSRQARGDLQAALAKALAPLPADDTLKIWAEDDHVTVRLAAPLLFDGNDTALNAKGADLLKKIAATLKATPGEEDIVVDAHTDNAPPAAAAAATGKPPNNWDLSARRAGAVVRVLGDNGIAANRLVARGLGGSRPIAANDGPDRAKNRRIEIAMKPVAATATAPATTTAAAPAPAAQ